MAIYCSDISERTPYPVFQGETVWIGSPLEPSGAICCPGNFVCIMSDIIWMWHITKHARSEWTKRFA